MFLVICSFFIDLFQFSYILLLPNISLTIMNLFCYYIIIYTSHIDAIIFVFHNNILDYLISYGH